MDYNTLRTYGLENEIKNLPLLQQKFGMDLRRTSNRYETYDFENDEYLIEQKSRRCQSNTYNSYMFGINKLNKDALTTNKKYIIVFDFIDGIFYYEFNKDDVDIGITYGLNGDKAVAYINASLFQRL